VAGEECDEGSDMTKERFIEILMENNLTQGDSDIAKDAAKELWDTRPPEVDTMSEEEVIRALRLALLIFSLQKSLKVGLN